VDLAGTLVFWNSQRHPYHQRRLENVFDRQYATALSTAERDSDGSFYTYGDLGVPRTLEARYTYKF